MMDRQDIRGALKRYAARGLAGTPDLWPAIERKVRSRRPRRFRLRRPATRLGWVGLTVAALLLLSTVAYATGTVLREVYKMDPEWRRIDERQLGQELDLSRTVEGCTITLERVYADRERIVIGYTVAGPQGLSLAPTQARLTDATGVLFPPSGAAGNVPEAGPSGWVLSYDASALDTVPSELDLHLSLSLVAIERGKAAPPVHAPAETQGDATVVQLEPLETTHFGPFSFDFQVQVMEAAAR